MNRKNKSLLALTLVSANLFAAVPALAGVIGPDFTSTTTIDAATSPLFSQTYTSSFHFDDAPISAPLFQAENLNSFPDFSLDFAGRLNTRSILFHGDAALVDSRFPGGDMEAPEFALVPANELLAKASSSDPGPGDAGNGDLTYVPLLGPVPEPSMTWLMVGALLALAGLSSGTRGIHESV